MAKKLKIELVVDDKGSVVVKRATDKMSRGFGKADKSVRKVDRSVDKLTSSVKLLRPVVTAAAGAFGMWQIKQVAGNFLAAANAAENYRTRLKVMLGSQAEGNRMFKEMADFAGRVPFEYDKIMASATSLSGVMRGGVDEVKQWMPLIGDLAATTGLTVEETTGQVIRMYSAGAGAADLFRDRGILAMMGFKAGVSYTAEETRKKMMEEWKKAGSQFRGATGELAKTWQGTMSMFGDQWFQFRNLVMDAGVFDVLKEQAQALLSEIERLKEERTLEEWAEGISTALETLISRIETFYNRLKWLYDLYQKIETGMALAAGQVPKEWKELITEEGGTQKPGWKSGRIAIPLPPWAKNQHEMTEIAAKEMKEREKIEKGWLKVKREMGKSATEIDLMCLHAQYEAYKKVAKDKVALEEWWAAEKARIELESTNESIALYKTLFEATGYDEYANKAIEAYDKILDKDEAHWIEILGNADDALIIRMRREADFAQSLCGGLDEIVDAERDTASERIRIAEDLARSRVAIENSATRAIIRSATDLGERSSGGTVGGFGPDWQPVSGSLNVRVPRSSGWLVNEATFGPPYPASRDSYQSGTGPQGLPRTGVFYGHKGEIVKSPAESDTERSGGTGNTYNITIAPHMMTGDRAAAREVAVEIKEALQELDNRWN